MNSSDKLFRPSVLTGREAYLEEQLSIFCSCLYSHETIHLSELKAFFLSSIENKTGVEIRLTRNVWDRRF